MFAGRVEADQSYIGGAVAKMRVRWLQQWLDAAGAPHTARRRAHARTARRLTDAMLDELERHVSGLPLRHEVTVDQLDSMA